MFDINQTKAIFLSFILLLHFYSCDKNEITHNQDNSLEMVWDELQSIDLEKNREDVNHSRASWVIINGNYLSNYTHYYQYTGSPGFNLCGPASYMVASDMTRGTGVSHNHLINDILDWLDDPWRFTNYDPNNTSVYHLWEYGRQVDQNPYIAKKQSNRTSFKTFFEATINSGRPVIAPITINPRGDHNNDGLSYNAPNTSYYVDPQKSVGHFIVIIGMQITSNETSSWVAYYDVLDRNKTLKVCDYKRFLDANANAAGSGQNSCLKL